MTDRVWPSVRPHQGDKKLKQERVGDATRVARHSDSVAFGFELARDHEFTFSLHIYLFLIGS